MEGLNQENISLENGREQVQPDVENPEEFLRENLQKSLEAIEENLDEIASNLTEIKNDPENELKIRLCRMKIVNVKASVDQLEGFYEIDEFPEMKEKLEKVSKEKDIIVEEFERYEQAVDKPCLHAK